jgi:dipeptidyl aminopeptidase/acylaminoacyl peptidase
MAMPQPPADAVRAISPCGQILAGRYHIPTFLAHGDNDREVPIEQSRNTVAALRASGVESGFAVVRGAGHSFDFRPDEDPLGTSWAVVQEAYDWASPFVGL